MRPSDEEPTIIFADGRILAIDRNVRPATSAEDMAAMLGRLEIPARE